MSVNEIIDGLILGGSGVTCLGINSRIKVVSQEKELLEHIQKVLSDLSWKITKDEPKERVTKDFSYIPHTKYQLVSKVSPILNQFRNRWYDLNVKIVPKDLKIAPTLLKYWFYTAGACHKKNKEKNALVITFCTTRFTKEECDNLAEKLKKINLNFYPTQKRKSYNLTLIAKADIVRLFENIGDYDISYLKEKWELVKNIK